MTQVSENLIRLYNKFQLPNFTVGNSHLQILVFDPCVSNTVCRMGKEDQPTSKSEVQRMRSELNKLVDAKMREEQLPSYKEFADKYEIGRTTLYELLRGRTRSRGALVKPSLDTLVKLAHALEQPTHDLLYLFEPEAPGADDVQTKGPRREVITVPVISVVGGGHEQHEPTHGEVVWTGQQFARDKDLIAFRADGDSMAAGTDPIHHGDRVLVDRNDPGHDTASIVARLKNDTLALKMLKDDRYGRYLQSRNPEPTDGSPTVIPIQDVAEILGRVVRVIHDT